MDQSCYELPPRRSLPASCGQGLVPAPQSSLGYRQDYIVVTLSGTLRLDGETDCGDGSPWGTRSRIDHRPRPHCGHSPLAAVPRHLATTSDRIAIPDTEEIERGRLWLDADVPDVYLLSCHIVTGS